MTEHNTRNTETVTAWCNQCSRNTDHSVSNGRRGRCIEHNSPTFTKKQLTRRAQLERRDNSGDLFNHE